MSDRVIEHNILGHEWPYVLASDYHICSKERDQLKAEVERLQRDKERLDWIVLQTDFHIEYNRLGNIYVMKEDEVLAQGHGLRTAIDAAMQKEAK